MLKSYNTHMPFSWKLHDTIGQRNTYVLHTHSHLLEKFSSNLPTLLKTNNTVPFVSICIPQSPVSLKINPRLHALIYSFDSCKYHWPFPRSSYYSPTHNYSLKPCSYIHSFRMSNLNACSVLIRHCFVTLNIRFHPCPLVRGAFLKSKFMRSLWYG